MPHEDIALLLPNARQAPRPCLLADKKAAPARNLRTEAAERCACGPEPHVGSVHADGQSCGQIADVHDKLILFLRGRHELGKFQQVGALAAFTGEAFDDLAGGVFQREEDHAVLLAAVGHGVSPVSG